MRAAPLCNIEALLDMTTLFSCYATCPKGLESLLLEELIQLDVQSSKETVGGVYFDAELTTVYRVCLWSRLANKVLLPLATVACPDEKTFYRNVVQIRWEEYFGTDATFKVDFSGTNRVIRNTQFGAVRIKDGVVDRFREQTGERPSIRRDQPDIVINARLLTSGKQRGIVHISLDLVGESLHRRGYRTQQGIAPLKENLASAILFRARWPDIANKGGSLLDPMCGSGTLLVEGAMIAADIAPGLMRERWSFTHWKMFKHAKAQGQWVALLENARQCKEAGLQRLREQDIEFRGYDINPQVLRAAEDNISLAGLHEFIRVRIKPVNAFKKPTHKIVNTGLVICNPPYGERLGEEEALLPVYRQLGLALRNEFTGWQAAIFTGNLRLSKTLGIRAQKTYKFLNGSIPTELVCFDIHETSLVREEMLKQDERQFTNGNDNPWGQNVLSDGAQMVCNRLKKNVKQLRKWREKNNIEAYRLYDADMPEYAAAIDIYGAYVHVQEYAAPKSIDERKAQQRFNEVLDAIPEALDIDSDNIFTKRRQRNKGKQQYERLDIDEHRAKIAVQEGKASLLVDLWSYLDTGLFLDHRPVRQLITQYVHDKTFLNLFCYTATATVHAALAGARSSISVDMSKTYIDWASENFTANNIQQQRHELVQQDCLSWLKQCRQGFDVIFLDPPSFSNSKRMDSVFDVQHDHASIIHRCMDLLNPGGTLIFSNNLRSFTLDNDISEIYSVDDISQKTLDADFQRNQKIHRCFVITAKE